MNIRRIAVAGTPRATLKIRSRLEEGTVRDAPAGYVTKGVGRNHIGYTFPPAPGRSATVETGK
jgi:hypothetical protein